MVKQYETRKSVELALKVANEWRLSKFDGTLEEWMISVNIPPHHLWGGQEEPQIIVGEGGAGGCQNLAPQIDGAIIKMGGDAE